MKDLQLFGNRVEDAANAFIDVLKYSDQSVDYPGFKDIEPWPDEIINMFYVIWKNAKFSELSSIIMYTQQSSRFEEISELMLGIGLVEMRHLDKISDFLQKADPYEDYDDVNYFLEKLIADEEHHIKLLKEAMGMDKATKGVTVIIK